LKPSPANFETPIEMITEHNLMHRLLIGINSLPYSQAERDREIIKLPTGIREFMSNKDHGFLHSQAVLKRCHEITAHCPELKRELVAIDLDDTIIEKFFTWGSILHDIARFLGYPGVDAHQKAGANLALASFQNEFEDDFIPITLSEIILRHDYFCRIIDNKPLPELFKYNPLAEIFRLADKISNTPEDELFRYYLTGQRLNVAFFKPMPFKQRIDFVNNYHERDMITHFLILFSSNRAISIGRNCKPFILTGPKTSQQPPKK